MLWIMYGVDLKGDIFFVNSIVMVYDENNRQGACMTLAPVRPVLF